LPCRLFLPFELKYHIDRLSTHELRSQNLRFLFSIPGQPTAISRVSGSPPSLGSPKYDSSLQLHTDMTALISERLRE
jgi:hypothetical protein